MKLSLALVWMVLAASVALAQDTPPDRLALQAELNALVKAGKAEESIRVAERIVAICDQTLPADHPDLAVAIGNLAYLYQTNGEYAKAEPFLLRLLKMQEKAADADPLSLAKTLNNLGELYAHQKAFDRAEPLLKRSLELREKALPGGHPGIAVARKNLADLYFDWNKPPAAEPLLVIGLADTEKRTGPNDPELVYWLNGLSSVYRWTGDYSRAIPLLDRVRKIYEAERGPNDPEVAGALNNIGALYMDLADYDHAQAAFERARGIFEAAQPRDDLEIARILNNIGFLRFRKGDYQAAESMYQESLSIREKKLGGDHPDVATTLGNLAEVYRSRAEYDRAEPLFRRSLKIRETALGENHPDTARSLNNLASVLLAEDKFNEAEQMMRRGIAVQERLLGEVHPDIAVAHSNLAEILRGEGKYEAAGEQSQISLAMIRKTLGPDFPEYKAALENAALISWALGKTQAALEQMAQAEELEEKLAESVLLTGSEQEKRAYMNSQSGPDGAITLHVRSMPDNAGAARLALTAILRDKGRALDAEVDVMSGVRSRSTPEERQLLDQLVRVRSELASRFFGSRRAPAQGATSTEQLRQEEQRLESAISAKNAEFAAKSQPISLEQVQAAIPNDALLLEIFRYVPINPLSVHSREKRRYVVYAIAHTGAPAWKDLGEADAIDAAVDSFRTAIGRDAGRGQLQQLGAELEAKIVQPLNSLLGTHTRLLISPDGQLNLLPFAALTGADGRPLLERFSFAYLTSGRDLQRLPQHAPSRQGDLIFADVAFDATKPRPAGGRRAGLDLKFAPLPGTAAEAKDLKELLPDARVLLGDAATEDALKQVRGPRILHLATHGFFLPDRPEKSSAESRGVRVQFESTSSAPQGTENSLLRSGLALAGANDGGAAQEDGIVTALEVSGLDLTGTEMVVLSACETAVGAVVPGDGVFGLRRALTLAGARTEVMTLWKVHDEATRELMAGFYRRLIRGEERGEALRGAQLEMLHRPERADPFFWASFILLGDTSPLPGRIPAK